MKINPREKKFLLAAVGVIIAYVLIQFVFTSGSNPVPIDAGLDQLALAQRTLRHDRELASASQLTTSVVALDARFQQEQKGLLAGMDPNQAGAQLQTLLANRAAAQQLEVVRTDFLPTAPVSPGYLRVPVRIELHGRITQLIAFLTSVTQGQPMASVDEAQFSNYSTAKEKQLLCVVVISGLMARPAAGAK